MADSFLRAYPDLRPFLVVNARSTGRTIGSGSYGSVEEVAIPGAVCAAKKIHDFFQDPTQISQEGIEKASREFVRECQLMSTLRHPYIVQFLGVCFLPGSRIPALVMEKLMTSLHAVLDPQPQPPTKAFIPVSMKCSILHNIASGLAFLHSHTPAIIHRDLSARNILLSVGMVAKIADLGMARIVPHMRVAATMTKAPGASIYMPPEALEDKSRYDVTIDIFSIGVLAIFVLSQTFPDPLAAAYMDDCGTMIGRTELERRDPYMHQLRRQFREGHPLLQLIRNSLKNRITERQTIQAIIQCLDEARAEIHDGYDISRLALVQALKQRAPLPQVNDEHIEQHHTKQQCQHNGWQQGENEFLKAQIKSLQEQLWAVKPAKGQLPQVGVCYS